MRAVFFDLDGTLLDTVGDIRRHVNGMLRAHSYPEITPEQARAYVGDGARRLIERSLPDGAADADACFAEFLAAFSASDSRETALFPGETEVLRELKGRGVKLAVITNKPQRATDGVLRMFFPEGFFDFVGGDSGMFPVKPDPSLTRYAALTLRVSLRDCVFVGDGETDVLTAKRTGMRGIAALWGYRTRRQLSEAGATEFAADYAELIKILGKEA